MEGCIGFAWMIEALMPKSCLLERGGRAESVVEPGLLALVESVCRPRERSADREVVLVGDEGVLSTGCVASISTAPALVFVCEEVLYGLGAFA